jgi:ferredoxin-NADP reductase/MOSC domain-containing protein YiiM/ferredoxin
VNIQLRGVKVDKVLSVNVGLPHNVEWNGRTVRTGIWKQPIEGKVTARRLNLDGDGQGDLAGHGGEHRAVMVYQADSYRYWENHLQRSGLKFGQFGENFTVDGLADDVVCIGDRFRIGSATFEVTQPRVTCYRLGIRMENPQMAALVVKHRRPGFYFRVIEEGEVSAGDEIVKLSDGPERITVAETSALLYLPDHTPDKLERALRIPALSPGWKSSLQALLSASLNGTQTGNAGLFASPSAPPSWLGFRRLKVVASTQESEDVRSFTLADEDGSSLPDPLPGQYIVVRLPRQPNTPVLMRNYSLSGPPGTGRYRISVKREPMGLASNYLHAHIRAGDILEASAPRGTFTLAAGAGPVVLLSAGVGITPVLAMLYASVAAEKIGPRDIWWIHGARDGVHHSFAGEVKDLIGSLKSVHSTVVYSRPSANDQRGRDYDADGHLDVALIERLGLPQDADFYLCGPTEFLDDMRSGLQRWGVATPRIHLEIFGAAPPLTPGVVGADHPSPHLPTGEAGIGPNVTFVRSGLSVPWNTRFQNLLELAEACDVPVKWSCRTGVCHNCESALVGGSVSYSPDPLDPPAAGNVLICCAMPTSEIELDL